MSPAPFTVTGFEDYLSKARENFVIADPAERRNLILKEAQKSAAEVGGKLFYTDELLETVSLIVEYPVIVRGGFEEVFKNLPKKFLQQP